MKQEVLFVSWNNYVDWEYAFLACSLQGQIKDKTSPYEVRTVSVNKAPVRSIGDMSWRTEEAKRISPLVQRTYQDGKVLGAICDATVFLGMNGLLNEKKHTSNTLEDLSDTAQVNYMGQANYLNEQAVRDGNLITASTGYLEFTKEVLTVVDAYPEDYIQSDYDFMERGYIEILRSAEKMESEGTA